MGGAAFETQQRAGFGVAWAAFAAVLAASLINLLAFQAYPLARAEVALLLAALALVAAALAGLTAWAGRIGQAAMAGLALLLAADFNSDGFALAAVAGLIGAGAGWRLGAGPVLRFTAIAASVVLATALIGLGGLDPQRTRTVARTAGAQPPGGRPAVLHLILDQQAGPAGLPAADAAWLEARYRAMGFTVYPRAYSRHYHTAEAVTELLSGKPSAGARAGAATAGLAARLKALGYANIHVTQTRHVEICAVLNAISCTSVSHSGLSVVGQAPLGASDKANILAYHFAGLSTVARKLANARDNWGPGRDIELRAARKVPALNALAAVPALEARLRAARPGDYHLAHLLLPHAPFALDSTCRVKRPGAWQIERSDAPLAERDAAYAEQMACAARVVERLVAALRASPGGKDAVILVHGDHGSRIVAHEPFGDDARQLNDDDVRRGFATLFALSLPGPVGGPVAEPAAINVLIEGLAAIGFRALPPIPAGEQWVYLGDDNKRPVTARRLPPLE